MSTGRKLTKIMGVQQKCFWSYNEWQRSRKHQYKEEDKRRKINTVVHLELKQLDTLQRGELTGVAQDRQKWKALPLKSRTEMNIKKPICMSKDCALSDTTFCMTPYGKAFIQYYSLWTIILFKPITCPTQNTWPNPISIRPTLFCNYMATHFK